MSNIYTTLSTSYSNAASLTPSKGKYVPVDAKLYEGTWTGKYGDNKSFSLLVSNVQGFRATVKYQSGGTVNFSSVLIKDNQFRIGDTKFALTGTGTALVATAQTDPVTGMTSAKKAIAKLDT